MVTTRAPLAIESFAAVNPIPLLPSVASAAFPAKRASLTYVLDLETVSKTAPARDAKSPKEISLKQRSTQWHRTPRVSRNWLHD